MTRSNVCQSFAAAVSKAVRIKGNTIQSSNAIDQRCCNGLWSRSQRWIESNRTSRQLASMSKVPASRRPNIASDDTGEVDGSVSGTETLKFNPLRQGNETPPVKPALKGFSIPVPTRSRPGRSVPHLTLSQDSP
jgi:hypothetical protein